MLALMLAKQFYTHDKGQGFIVVGIVCGLMVLWALYVAFINFGPPAKKRAANQDR